MFFSVNKTSYMSINALKDIECSSKRNKDWLFLIQQNKKKILCSLLRAM